MIRALLALGLLASSASASAAPLIFHNGRLFVQAKVNNVATEALLDSGAEGTIVDPQLAVNANFPVGQAQVIKGSGGSAAARIVEGVTIEALGVELHPEAVVVLDMTDLSTRLIKRPTHVVLGRELFDAARLQIDIGHNSIEVVDKARIPVGRKLSLTGHAGIEGIPVLADGIPAQAEFDLGNGSDAMISRDLAKKLHLKILGKKGGGGIGGSIERDFVRLGTLEIAGRKFRDVTASIDDQPSHGDMNVGTAILKNFLITTDFKDHAVWLASIGSSH